MQSCFYFTNLLPTVPTYDKMICYYITKEEMNLPPSSRLEISSCNRTTSFHHTPLLYWALRPPIVKPTFFETRHKCRLPALELQLFARRTTSTPSLHNFVPPCYTTFLTHF